MNRKIKKLVHEGDYLAEVEVATLDDESPWSPYLSHEDALKLDRVRLALRRGDIAAATKEATVFKMTLVAAESP